MPFSLPQTCWDDFSRPILLKNGRRLSRQLLRENQHRTLVERYLAFQPRNSFQGLPPLKDEVCVRWVEEMIRTGMHLVAIDSGEGIVGHTALFPIDPRKCEMLIVVWPDFQNLGIGTELTRGCIHLAETLGFEKMWLPVDATNVRARHMYSKCGFEYVSSKQGRELDMVCPLGRDRGDEISPPPLPQTAAFAPLPFSVGHECQGGVNSALAPLLFK